MNDELTSGNHDWILWLDADAFVWDHSIDVNTAVVDSQYALIGTAGSPINDGQDGHKTQTEIQWDINSGVFFVNMKHDKTKEVLELSKELYLANINFEDIGYEIVVEPKNFESVSSLLDQNNIDFDGEISLLAQNTIKVSEYEVEKIIKLLELLEEHDDVQNVYSNFEVE